MQSFHLKFIDRLERSNADHYHQTDVVFDFKTACMCTTGSVTMRRCILIVEQKQNGNLILTATVRNIQYRLFTYLLQARLQTPQYIYRYVILWYVPYIICVHITTWLITYKQ